MGLALLHQLQVLGRRQVAEGELQRLKIPGVDGGLGHLQPVVGDTDVADVALLLHLQSGGKGAVRVLGVRQDGGIVELKQINVVRLQTAKALLNMAQDRLLVLATALGGDHHILANTLKGNAQLFLAVGVGVGGVKIVDAALVSLADQLHRVRLGNALDGQGAEGCLGHPKVCAAESDLFHVGSSCSRRSGAEFFLSTGIVPHFSPFANQPRCDKIKRT